MSTEPAQKFMDKLRSIFSITLFFVLLIGVSYMSWNLIAALIEKFA